MTRFKLGLSVPLLSFAMILGTMTCHAQTPSPPPQAQVPAPTPTPQASRPIALNVPPLSLRVEAIPPVELKSAPTNLSLKDFAPTLGAIIGLIGAFAAVWISAGNNSETVTVTQKNNQASIEAAQRNAESAVLAAQRNNEATLWQKANETELKEIQAKLDSFYGPFLQLSGMNGLLAHELRARQPDAETFRLLKSVCNSQWLDSLSQGDKTVVREICNNAATLQNFLSDKAATVDAKVLPHLYRASAHFRILHLAYIGDLGTDPTNFLLYVYPWQLDKVLELEVVRLQRRCNLLRTNPTSTPGLIEPLEIPPDLGLLDWPAPPRAPLTAGA
jgi:hypothetical protein